MLEVSDLSHGQWAALTTYQSKVDSVRENWTDFDSLYRGSPHAAEMVAAEREQHWLTRQAMGSGTQSSVG